MRTVLLPSLAALAVTASLFATGCGKSPESVCKKLEEIMKEADKDKDKKEEKDEGKKKKQMEECTKELTEIKEASPKGYECMVGCTDYKTAGAAFGCLAECGEKDEKLKEHRKKKREKEEEDRAKKMVEWTKLADKAFDSSVKDYKKNETKFTITLAEGFTSKDIGDTMKSFELEDTENFTSVHLTVRLDSYPEDMEKAVTSAKSLKKEVVKKEEKNGGYVLQLEGEHDVGVEALVKVGDANLKCSGNIYSENAKKFKDDLLPWMAKLCGSMKAK